MWAARETCYMHVLRERASASGTPFTRDCEGRDTAAVLQKASRAPEKANQKTTAAAEAIATHASHGLLTRRQSPPQFVHNAIFTAGRGQAIRHDAPQSQGADCGGTALGRDRRGDHGRRQGGCINALDSSPRFVPPTHYHSQTYQTPDSRPSYSPPPH